MNITAVVKKPYSLPAECSGRDEILAGIIGNINECFNFGIKVLVISIITQIGFLRTEFFRYYDIFITNIAIKPQSLYLIPLGYTTAIGNYTHRNIMQFKILKNLKTAVREI